MKNEKKFWDIAFSPSEMAVFSEKWENENDMFLQHDTGDFFLKYGFHCIAFLTSILFTVISATFVLGANLQFWIIVLIIMIFAIFLFRENQAKKMEKKHWIDFFKTLQNACSDVFFLVRDNEQTLIPDAEKSLSLYEKSGGAHWKALSNKEIFFHKGDTNQRIGKEIWVSHGNNSVYCAEFLYDTEHRDKNGHTRTVSHCEPFFCIPFHKNISFRLEKENLASQILKMPFVSMIIKTFIALSIPFQGIFFVIMLQKMGIFSSAVFMEFLMFQALAFGIFFLFKKAIFSITQHIPPLLLELPLIFGVFFHLFFHISNETLNIFFFSLLLGVGTFFLFIAFFHFGHWEKVMHQDISTESSHFNEIFRTEGKDHFDTNAAFDAMKFLTPHLQELLLKIENMVEIKEVLFREDFLLVAMQKQVNELFLFKNDDKKNGDVKTIFERLSIFFALENEINR